MSSDNLNPSYNPLRTHQATLQYTNLIDNIGDLPSVSGVITRNQNYTSDNTSMSLVPDDTPSEPPPAYTPTADPCQGEAPLEFGPRRPFRDSLILPQPNIAPAVPEININDTGTSTSDRGRQPSRFNFEPPPRHPSTIPSSPPSTSSSYISSLDNLRTYDGSVNSPTQVQSYSPPPGPPPRRAVSFSDRPSGSTSEENSIRDDGRPTTTPTPGHPLLREGKLLVYPNGFECSKCRNTGFKNNDPSHPCSKCWNKYSKPYAGALAYAPFGSPGSPNNAGSFQRPLPVLRPPQAQQRPHSTAGYPGKLHRSLSRPQLPPPSQAQLYQPHLTSHNPQFYPPPRNPAPPAQGYPSPQYGHPSPHHQGPLFSPPPGPPQILMQPQAPAISFPVPQTVRVALPPGDPRIGGRLCWRCDGRGRVSFLIFDSTPCEVCRGIGRVFN